MRRKPDYRRIVVLERATGFGPERDHWVPVGENVGGLVKPLPKLGLENWSAEHVRRALEPNHYVTIAHRRRVAANVVFLVATIALFWTYVGWLILSQGGS